MILMEDFEAKLRSLAKLIDNDQKIITKIFWF